MQPHLAGSIFNCLMLGLDSLWHQSSPLFFGGFKTVWSSGQGFSIPVSNSWSIHQTKAKSSQSYQPAIWGVDCCSPWFQTLPHTGCLSAVYNCPFQGQNLQFVSDLILLILCEAPTHIGARPQMSFLTQQSIDSLSAGIHVQLIGPRMVSISLFSLLRLFLFFYTFLVLIPEGF